MATCHICPCPVPDDFGGHEWLDSPFASIPTEKSNVRTGICPKCTGERERAAHAEP